MRVALIVFLICLILSVIVFVLVVSRSWLNKRGWRKAEASAQWTLSTHLDWEKGQAVISIRRVAKWGWRERILATKRVTTVNVVDIFDPNLLEAQAQAMSLAENYNMIGSS